MAKSENLWKNWVKNQPIDDDSINRLLDWMSEIADKKSASQKLTAMLYEAQATIIRQNMEIKKLQKQIAEINGGKMGDIYI